MYDSSEEPCCMGFVTSGGDDRCHEPGCPEERPGPYPGTVQRLRVRMEGDQEHWEWHTERVEKPVKPVKTDGRTL